MELLQNTLYYSVAPDLSDLDVSPGDPVTNDYTEEQRYLLALLFTLVKVLYIKGALAYIPALMKLLGMYELYSNMIQTWFFASFTGIKYKKIDRSLNVILFEFFTLGKLSLNKKSKINFFKIKFRTCTSYMTNKIICTCKQTYLLHNIKHHVMATS